jgi:hypothetical protein
MVHLAYPLAAQRKFALALLVFAAGSVTLGCKAGVTATPSPGTGGHAGTAGPGAGGTTGTGGNGMAGTAPPIGGFGGSTDGGTACQHTAYTFEPKIPTVYLLVDRSGSMFHCLTGNTGDPVCATPANTSWSNLKEAIRTVVASLDTQVRFGFATIWGTDPSQGGMCPATMNPPQTTDQVAPALNNATAIMTKYDGLPFPPVSTQQGVKFESPTSESLLAIGNALQADTTPGDKYIILLTDGQPDYCDDSNSLCAPDSVIMHLQLNKAAGITTIVLGVQTTLFDLGAGVLQAYANAGAGEPTVAPLRTGLDSFAFYDQCNGVAGWKADLTASGKPNARGTTLGTYMATPGPTHPYMPSASDQTQLVSQLSAALSGVKSCTFDLNGVGGVPIKVDLTKLDKATIKIEGTTVPLDANSGNGWNMVSATQLELFGSACDSWRDPNAKTIDFNFPCEIIVD